MARLDSDERDAAAERIAEGAWETADGDQGRQMLAKALFKRLDVRGFRELILRLTD